MDRLSIYCYTSYFLFDPWKSPVEVGNLTLAGLQGIHIRTLSIRNFPRSPLRWSLWVELESDLRNRRATQRFMMKETVVLVPFAIWDTTED